jgi:pimeloyl-ACP methyl ester carboxylesterase
MSTITLPQGTIRHQDSGVGVPIVFVHGLLVNGSLWRKVVPSLSKSARCTAASANICMVRARNCDPP